MTRKLSALDMDDLRLLGVACVSCMPLKAVLTPILSAVKPFLPPAGRDLSQRDWERVLISRPRMVVRTLLDMCGHLTQGPLDHATFTRAVGLFSDALLLHGQNKHMWSSNLRANRCSRATSTILDFCSSMAHIAAAQAGETERSGKVEDEDGDDNAVSCLVTLKAATEGLQTLLCSHFSRPRHHTACSYSIRHVAPYPGRGFERSHSQGVCSALGLYRTVSRTENQHPQQSGWGSEVRDSVHLMYLPPSIPSHDPVLQSGGPPRGSYWWWDASRACDWPLVRSLLPTAARIENPKDLELFLQDCVRNGAGADIVSDFIRLACLSLFRAAAWSLQILFILDCILFSCVPRCVFISLYCLLFFRAGVQVGNVTEHIELAGCKGDCRSFLLLLLGGALSPSMSLMTCREEGVQGLCETVAKSLSKVCTLHRQYSTVLSRQSRMSLFGSVWGASKARTVPSHNLYYRSAEARTNTTDRERRGESLLSEDDAAVKISSGSGGGRRSVTLQGSTLDTSCGAEPPVMAPSERDLGLSMELSVSIIKDVMSLILSVKAEMDSEHEVGKRGRGSVPEEEGDGDEIAKQLFSRSSYTTGHACRPPASRIGARTGGRLQDHFMVPVESCPIGDTARLTELKNRTTVRIVRAIMAKGTAATVLETVKILRSTFGHGSGNILLPMSPYQVRRHKHPYIGTHIYIGAHIYIGTHIYANSLCFMDKMHFSHFYVIYRHSIVCIETITATISPHTAEAEKRTGRMYNAALGFLLVCRRCCWQRACSRGAAKHQCLSGS
jgi:hypothetical protein